MKKTILLLFAAFLFFTSCNKNDSTNPSLSQYPATPSNPSPANNATDVPDSGILTWNACPDPEGDPVTYAVVASHDATLSTPFFVESNLTAPTCTIPGQGLSATIYWKVTASDNHLNVSDGPVWKFTTTDDLPFGTFTDARDGKTYRTIVIGTQTWMADNLAFIPDNPSCYDFPGTNSSMVPQYGLLYNDLTDLSTLAPQGWHIPSASEFMGMVDYLGGPQVAGGKMKETGFDFWMDPNTGATNESGFSARGAGGAGSSATATFRRIANFYGQQGTFSLATIFVLETSTIEISSYTQVINPSFSIRCVKNR